MVQFNLLPDVKIEFIKARRQKHLITVISLFVSIASVALLVISFLAVNVGQKQYLRILDNNIKNSSNELQKVPDINKILTVQNQLNRLTELHDGKPVTSRVFAYIGQLTPTDVTLNKLSVDYATTTMEIGGAGKSLDAIRVFADTLKSAKYKNDANSTSTSSAFSEVTLSQFARQQDGTNFTLTMKFEPTIYNAQQADIALSVLQSAGDNKANVFEESN